MSGLSVGAALWTRRSGHGSEVGFERGMANVSQNSSLCRTGNAKAETRETAASRQFQFQN